MGGEVVVSVVTIASFRPNGQEITDRRMMRDLFAVDLRAIREGALQGLAKDWVELNSLTITGFTNMEI